MIKPRIAPPYNYNWVFPAYDFALLGVPKCGSVSLRKAFWQQRAKNAVSRKIALQMSVRLAVIRHPVDRLFSAHAYGWSEVPFAEWWAFVKKNPHWDIHTFPVVDWLDDAATHIRPLEQIDSWWPWLRAAVPVTKQPPHKNKGSGARHDEYIDEIVSVYHDDLQLFHSVLQG